MQLYLKLHCFDRIGCQNYIDINIVKKKFFYNAKKLEEVECEIMLTSKGYNAIYLL